MAYRFDAQQPWVTTDVVILTIAEQRLKLLLIKHGDKLSDGQWLFPGGFVGPKEDLAECARRTLQEEAGISSVYLEQLYTFGQPSREPQERVITVAYFAIVPMDRLYPRPTPENGALRWFSLDRLPSLSSDMEEIVTKTGERLRAKLHYSTIAFQFMPEFFTLSELQAVYEIILRGRLDKRNFRKQVLSLERIEDTGKVRRVGSHRPARLYQLRYPERVEIIK